MPKDKPIAVAQLNKVIRDERLIPSRKMLAILLRAYIKSTNEKEKADLMDVIVGQYGTGRRSKELVAEEGNPKVPDLKADEAAKKNIDDVLARLKGGENATVLSYEDGSAEFR